MNITNIDIVPNVSGCGHAELRMTIGNLDIKVPISKSQFILDTPEEEITATAVDRIRSHIKESGLTSLALIRADLQTRSFKI